MKHRILSTAAALALTASFGLADAPNPEEPSMKDFDEEVYYTEVSQPGIVLSGYIDVGYSYNFIGQGSTIQNRAFTNDGADGGDFNVNQVKLVLEKALSEENEFSAGFRVDMMYGEDAADFSGQGFNTDAFYLQQAYVAIGIPLEETLAIAFGRWGSPVGYEADERVDNLNITIGNMAAIDPGPMHGAIGSYPVGELAEIGLGVGNGSGLADGVGVGGSNDEYAFTGYFYVSNPSGNAEAQFSFHTAPWGDSGYGQTDADPGTVLNLWGNWFPEFADGDLQLSFNTSFAWFDGFAADAAGGGSTFTGAALYARYFLNDWLSVAGRGEYVHTDDDSFLGIGSGGSNDLWGITGTLGFHLADDFLIRTEYRFDWGNDIVSTTGNATYDGAHSVAMQAVYSF